jgi:hypothetical protein
VEDRRCKRGLAGRLQLVRFLEGGCSLRAAAAEDVGLLPTLAQERCDYRVRLVDQLSPIA